MDFVIATATKRDNRWELRSFGKVSKRDMRQYRQAWPGLRVRQFTSEEWDALPYGQRSEDWVSVGGQSWWRYPDGVRPNVGTRTAAQEAPRCQVTNRARRASAPTGSPSTTPTAAAAASLA